MSIELQARGKMVLVQAITPDAGLIQLPTAVAADAHRAHQRPPEIYIVVNVGEGRMTSDGKIIPIDLQPGDEVFIGPDTPLVGPSEPIYGLENHFFVDIANVYASVSGRDGKRLPIPTPKITRTNKLVGVA